MRVRTFVLLSLFVLAAICGGFVTHATPSVAAAPTTTDCPNWRNYAYTTQADTKLDALLAQVNDLPGHRLPENGRYLVEDIVSIQVLQLPSGEYQVVALLYVQDTCDRPRGE